MGTESLQTQNNSTGSSYDPSLSQFSRSQLSLNRKLTMIPSKEVQISLIKPARKRRIATQLGGEVRKLELEFMINNWRANHPKEWALLTHNSCKVPFFDSFYAGLMRWGFLTNRHMLALKNYTHPSSKLTVH
jgi:hypothetical protein